MSEWMAMAGGRAVIAAVGFYCLLVGLLFHDTLSSMVSIWLRSQTFAHGILIAPISLWLAWRLRRRASRLSVQPDPRALLLVLVAGLTWLFAHMVDVQVIQQLAFVAVLVSGIWAIVGTRLARCHAFPLGFLFLAVPMGAGLIPPLMEFTADTTEFMLRASGIPVFREGMYLTLATGTWSVIEECSGVRYLIASVTLGLLYAYLTYDSLWRQAVFVAAAIVVPIVANSLRAYGVVMVGHLSDTRLGVGDDHLIYGWVFFGLVMLLMFWIGGLWQQHAPARVLAPGATTPVRRNSNMALVLCTGLAVLSASAWPALALAMNRNPDPVATVPLSVPETLGAWQATNKENWHWSPAQQDADRQLDQNYAIPAPGSPTVGLHVRQYLQQHQGAELVNSADPWRPDRRRWRVIGHRHVVIDLAVPVSVDEVRVVSERHDLLVWSWYRVAGHNTANPFLAKLFEARQQLLEGRRQGARLFVVTTTDQGSPQARNALQAFVAASHNTIEASLDSGTTAQVIADGPTSPGVDE